MKKSTRSWSGVLPLSLALEGNSFSCKHDCSFCPAQTVQNGAEKTIARSYLSSEGTFIRGNMSDFKSFHQVIRRLLELESMNHYPDKLEIIILGGTWNCYPVKYRNEFIHDIYYACNIYYHYSKYFDKKFYHRTEDYLNQQPFQNKLPLPEDFFNEIRPRESLEDEKYINTNLKGVRIIGIVLETRPDYIKFPTVLEKRRLGCTRVQLGIQHTDNEVLLNNKRGHSFETSLKAMKILKNNCFKVDGHVMPDLPFTTIEKDYEMVNTIFRKCHLDYVKIYPCLDLPYTQARKWKQEGVWQPYAETNYNDFLELLAYTLSIVPPWTRINRVQRDFPKASDKNQGLGYESEKIETNLHQFVQEHLKKTNRMCIDIRNREIKNNVITDFSNSSLYIRKYRNDNATEYFISFEKQKSQDFDDTILLGFARLRILDPETTKLSECVPSLRSNKIARLRELHVYGFISNTLDKVSVQHKGIGKLLLKTVEWIAYKNNCKEIAVISGVGVRGYYKKLGYFEKSKDMGEYLFKNVGSPLCCRIGNKIFIYTIMNVFHLNDQRIYHVNNGVGYRFDGIRLDVLCVILWSCLLIYII
jgi:ELP3 family radical SAM enzyme/protein acetyltransferase